MIVHVEAMRDPELIIQKCHGAEIEVGFAVKPDTPISMLDPWLEKVDVVLLLRVQPGASGQALQSEMLMEIEHVRKSCPGCIIEVDGGVSVDNVQRAAQAGASLLVAGGVIFAGTDPGDIIKRLGRKL